ncbi:MAG TPA: sigma-70 family RNA polymerase sigma factor [Steroidobacteraceae bacterium]|nr:sigma-70 family RNA polymerase sigma factor [Steroidobacteraceae bacterium]
MSNPHTEPPRPDEFTTFMRAYQDMVYTTAARLTGQDAQAQDIAQEVFLRAYEHFGQLRDSPTAGGWLKTVTRNLSLNHLTRHRRRWRLFSEMATAEDEDTGPEMQLPAPDDLLADLTLQERREFIEAALQHLPERQRIALVLYHFEELAYEEIARQLRLPLATLKSDIHRGRRALLKQMHSRGLSAAVLEA